MNASNLSTAFEVQPAPESDDDTCIVDTHCLAEDW